MNIEQIAMEVRKEMSSAILPQVVGAYEEVFLRRCLSKLAEQEVEPVAVVDEVGLCFDGRPIFNGVGKVAVGTKLYTEAQYIAGQQRAAEACAKVCKSRAAQHASEIREDEADKCAEAIQNGEWRGYL